MIINHTKAVKDALELLNFSGMGVCFVVDENTKLLGILTDGDLRRGLLKYFQLDDSVSSVMNTSFVSLPVETDNQKILECLNTRIKVIPLVNEENQVVDYATINKIRRIPIANPILDGNELTYVTECIKTNWISSQGKFVKRFEEQFSTLLSGQHALAVSNGTVAIHLALVALGIGPGDEVIVPDLTFAATINAVLYSGAKPVIVDVDPVTWCIDPAKIREAVTERTKAIIPVHLFGHPADSQAIMDIAKSSNLLVIEDCAEALGSEYYGRPVGYYSDASTFSFFGNKTITTGEGGMVVFRDETVAKKARTLRDHGMSRTKKYWHETIGYNYRLTNLQAAIGVAQMERLDQILEKKRGLARYYEQYLAPIDHIQTQGEAPWAKHSYWMYCIYFGDNSTDRDGLHDYLYRSGIETRPIFYPLSSMPIYSQYYSGTGCENSRMISSTGLCLPSSIDIDEEVVHRIVDQIQQYISQTV